MQIEIVTFWNGKNARELRLEFNFLAEINGFPLLVRANCFEIKTQIDNPIKIERKENFNEFVMWLIVLSTQQIKLLLYFWVDRNESLTTSTICVFISPQT